MKVLQVVDQLSKKNFSLVSVAKIINSFKFLSKNSKIITLKNYEKINKVIILKDFWGILFFNSKFIGKIKNQKPDVFHIHGMWGPIQFFFILYSFIFKIPLIVQPHGMLLPEALRSKSILSYILKLINIYFFYKFLLSKCIFIAVTTEEKKFILKYFKKSKVFIIKNSFHIPKINVKKINKKFVYFGRYNKHKNLKEFIQAYIFANPDKDWTLEIYGIEDDLNYKAELIDLVKKNKFNSRIKFIEPEFNIKKKFKILSQSWCNVLVSKSEVLSLSVLEALSQGVQSLVNKNIYFPEWIKKNLIICDLKISTLAGKINFIINQSYKKHISLKDKIKKSFFVNYNFDNEKEIYKKALIYALNKKKEKEITSNNFFNVVSVVMLNILNSVLIPFLIVLSVIFGNPSHASEIALIPGSVSLILQIFSANARSLLIYNINKKFLYEVISFRFFLNIFFFITTFFLIKVFYYNQDFNFFIILILITSISWMNEIFITTNEKNKKYLIINFSTILLTLLYILIALTFFQKTFSLNLILIFYLFFQMLFFLIQIDLGRLNFSNFIHYFNSMHRIRPTFSTFSNIISVIIWRVSLLFCVGKYLSGIYFAAFSIASFPGTLFNNLFAQTVIKNKAIRLFLEKTYFKVVLILFIFICTAILATNTYLSSHVNFNLFITTLVSFMGTVIMVAALYIRHKKLSLGSIYQQKIFDTDVIFSILIAPMILIIYFIGGQQFLLFSYLLSSVTSYICYKSIKL
jgi:glycosyltransferase involved in cell wall biosynthesis